MPISVRRLYEGLYDGDFHGRLALVGSLAIFIRPESDHWLHLSLTSSLAISCLVYFIYVTLACEDTNSLFDVFTVTVDDAEKRVYHNAVQIWQCFSYSE